MMEFIAARAASLVGSKKFGASFSGEDLIDFDLHPDSVQQFGKIGDLHQDADRPDQSVVIGENTVGAERDDIAARSRHTVHHRDDRLLFRDAAQSVVNLFRSGHGAARAGDIDDHGAGAGFADILDQLERFAVAGDQALDLDPRDMGREMGLGAAEAARRDDDRDDGRRQGEKTPEGDFAAQLPPIENGFNRRGLRHAGRSGRSCLGRRPRKHNV